MHTTAQFKPAAAAFDVAAVRRDFPILSRQVRGKPLVYLDNAATAQKPRAVIDAVANYYADGNANIHRGLHYLSETSTLAYEAARGKVQGFLNAAASREIVFVRGATEAINLVASTYGAANIAAGDEIIISTMEHHSNIVPWQMLCDRVGATLRVIPMTDAGELDIEAYNALLSDKTKLVAVTHVSNALGTVNPVHGMTRAAKAVGAAVLIDGAQAVPHTAVDVQELNCDFYVFSGHKVFGPTGIGALYAKAEMLEAMPPYQGGGDMILSVSFDKTTYNDIPYRFEAGTPNIAGSIGLGAAIDYITHIGLDAVTAYEAHLLDYATARLGDIDGLRIVGTAADKASVLSFVLDAVHPHDIGTLLDHHSIAIRAGHHCTQPLMQRLGLTATARASLAFYNTTDEIDRLADAIPEIIKVFS
jgi:cysteine desulfurase/selenocysteine lyase